MRSVAHSGGAADPRRGRGSALSSSMADTDPHAPLARATVTCHDEVADLSVADAATGKVVSRSISLAHASPGRLLALAVAELVAASWEEVKSQPPPKVPPLVPAPKEARAAVLRVLEQRRQGSPQAPPPEDMPIVTIEVAADARGFFDTRTVLFGGEVRAGIRLIPEVFLLVAGAASTGTVGRSAGDVDVSSVDGSLGAGWAHENLRVWAGGVGEIRPYPGPRSGTVPRSGRVGAVGWTGAGRGRDLVAARNRARDPRRGAGSRTPGRRRRRAGRLERRRAGGVGFVATRDRCFQTLAREASGVVPAPERQSDREDRNRTRPDGEVERMPAEAPRSRRAEPR